MRLSKDLTELSVARWSAQSDVRITLPYAHQQHLHVSISPQHGLYRGSSFLFVLHLPSSYPFSPPHVRCLTPILHPFISFRTGKVHHPILHEQWKPVLTLNTVLFALQLLFFLDQRPPLADQLPVGLEDEEEEGRGQDGAGRGRGGGGGSVSRECEEEVREMMEKDRALFEHSVQQTLDGGFFFGQDWPRNRGGEGGGRAGEDLDERKEGGGSSGAEEEEEKARKRRVQLGGAAGREEGEAEAEEEDDGCRRRHKAPHRHTLHSRPTAPATLPLAPSRARRAAVGVIRDERKESGDVAMGRADSFSFHALRSSLTSSPPPRLPSPSPSATLNVSKQPAASLYSLQSPLAQMQRRHALKTSMWSAPARHTQRQPQLLQPLPSSSSLPVSFDSSDPSIQPLDVSPSPSALSTQHAASDADQLHSAVRSHSSLMSDG